MSVPVRLETAAGPRDERVWIEDRIERFRLTVDAEPLSLEIDPDARLFRRLDAGETPPILRLARLDARTAHVLLPESPAAVVLAYGMLEREPGAVESLTDRPLLIIGTTNRVAEFLAVNRLPETPEALRGRGDVRAWTARRDDGQPLVVVEAKDEAALAGVARRLPHYGASSYVVFDGGELIDRGVWSPADRPLRHAFK